MIYMIMKKLLFSFVLTYLSFVALAQVTLKFGASSVNYPTITSAISAIPSTISQPYMIELEETYNGVGETYPIRFNVKTGASSTNTITLRPALEVGSVTISASQSGNPIILLDNADYVIIDGRPGGVGTSRALTIRNTATFNNSNNINLLNGACFNSLRYCNIINSATTNINNGRNVYFGPSASEASGNSDNLVEFCTLTCGRYGINSSGTAATPNRRNVIANNILNNIIFAGVWAQVGTENMTVDNNTLQNATPSPENLVFPMLFDVAENPIITNNRIFNVMGTSGTTSAIAIRSIKAGGTCHVQIHNNAVASNWAVNNVSQMYGIQLGASPTSAFTADIFYNTIVLNGKMNSNTISGNVGSSCFFVAPGALATINLKNNIFSNKRVDANESPNAHLAFAVSDGNPTIQTDYNTYFAVSNLVKLETTFYNDMAIYITATGKDEHSNKLDVPFVSNLDLRLTGIAIDHPSLIASPISGLDRDIDNKLRIKPYRGAYEAYGDPLPVKLLDFTAKKMGKSILLNWRTANEVNNSHFLVERRLANGSFAEFKKILAKTDGQLGGNTYQLTDFNPLQGTNYYKLTQFDLNGDAEELGIRSITMMTAEDEVMVYPNPAVHSVLLSFKQGKYTRVQLNDLNGKTVYSGDIDRSQTEKAIDVSNMAKGVYFFILKGTGEKNETLKLIKK